MTAMRHLPSARASWRRLAVLIALYWAAVWVGLHLVVEPAKLSIFWPAGGVALAALVTTPRSQWWILFATWFGLHVASELAAGFIFPLALAYPLVGMGSAALAAWLICRTTPAPIDPTSLRTLYAIAGWTGLVVTPLSATIAAAIQSRALDSLPSYGMRWRVWWTSELLGELVVAPMLLAAPAFWRQWRRSSMRRRLEVAGLMLVVVGLTQGNLSARAAMSSSLALALLVLPSPLLVWLALRAGVGGVSIVFSAISLIISWHTVLGEGPFVIFANDPAHQVMLIQVYLASVVVPSLFLAAAASDARQTAERVREIYDHSSEAMFLVAVHEDGAFVYEAANPRAAARLAPGISAIGRTPAEIMPPEAAEQAAQRFGECVRLGDTTSYEIQIDFGQGPRTVHTSLVPIRDGSGSVRHIAGFSMDVTERIESEKARMDLERQLRVAQKMEAVGRLGGGMAHEFNNVLTAMIGHATLLREASPKDAATRESVDAILEGGARAASLVRQVLLFSRPQEQPRAPIRLQNVAAEAIRLLRPTVPSTIEIRQLVDPECPPVLADPTQVHQVLINLASNAVYAMRDRKGVLGIHVSTVPSSAPIQVMSGTLPPGSYVCLTVTDTGGGMTPEILEQIYEPFFTTKPLGEGSGLGIPVVLGIMQTHHGGLAIETGGERGTTVRAYFPALPLSTELPGRPDVTAPSGHGERVLFVDDEPALCRLAEQMLRALGYLPTVFTSATIALESVRTSAGFDAVVTDFTMPGMTGVQFAAELARVHPGLPVVLVSGVPIGHDLLASANGAVKEVMMKPYTRATLGEALARVIAGAVPR